MVSNPVKGAGYLLRGFRMLAEPGLRAFVVVPLTINVTLFVVAICLLVQQFSLWVDYWLSLMPEWLGFLDWLLWPVFALLVLISVYFSFGIIANFIAAPFNGLLSERVEQRLRGAILPDDGWKGLVGTIGRSLQRELAKLGYYLPRFVLLFIVTLIPVIGLAAPLLWFLFGAWIMSIQYCDYPMDNNRVRFGEMKNLLKQRRLSSLGFGALVSVGMLVPVLNLLIMPAAVIGATIFWVEEYASAGSDLVEQP